VCGESSTKELWESTTEGLKGHRGWNIGNKKARKCRYLIKGGVDGHKSNSPTIPLKVLEYVTLAGGELTARRSWQNKIEKEKYSGWEKSILYSPRDYREGDS